MKFVVAENQRGLLIEDGRITDVLEPGRHRIANWLGRKTVEIVDAVGVFNSPWAEIMEKRRDEVLGIIRG